MQTLFPNGANGAVSLTYDDGLAEHLDHAMPDLEAAGLRGSFYIPTRQYTTSAWTERPADWVAAAERGHEIGNHSQHHSCTGAFNWIKPGHARESYDLARMEGELRGATDDLRSIIGPAASQTLAYPCCEDWVGPDHTSLRPLADRLFLASRGGRERTLADPQTFDFRYVPSWELGPEHSIADITAFIDEAIARGQWAVLMFHGVGGGHRLNVEREVHQAICQHIISHRSRIACDSFVSIAQHLRRALGKPWTAI